MENNKTLPTREQLILAGAEELNRYGVGGFSTRRVAKACGLSCAAPYKHFKDTHAFIGEIFGYVEREFLREQEEVLRACAGQSTRQQLVAVSMAYIRFLTEHPTFRSVVMSLFRDCREEYHCLQGQLSVNAAKLVAQYCIEAGIPPETQKRKTFLIRSLIYSAAMFFDSGELPYTAENLTMVEKLLDREFDLP